MKMEKRKLVNAGWLAILAIAVATPLSAHHSGAGYDMTKTLSAHATLKEFRWGAPHSAVVFLIKGTDGKQQEVSMGSASPAAFSRQGFNPRDFKVGDKMDITWHPSKNGAIGGTLATITLANGRKFGDAEFGPGGTQTGRSGGGGPADAQLEAAQFPPGAVPSQGAPRVP